MTTLSSAVASTPTNLQLIMQAARAGKLREPDGDQPRGTVPVFFEEGSGYYEMRYITRREFAHMSSRARTIWPTTSTEAAR